MIVFGITIWNGSISRNARNGHESIWNGNVLECQEQWEWEAATVTLTSS
ncbi:hypothetical protein OSTOST_23711 [Ostertagia ostertagi]